MKILITILGILNGGYMLLDGIYVIVKGKYIGPEKPGPWAEIFYKFNIDVYRLGWLFIFFGICWIAWLFGILTNKDWAYFYGIIICILTLWYLPVGTLFSIIILIVLIFFRGKTGI